VRAERYPFTPKSTAGLQLGQLWSIALPDGRYACGRVLATEVRGHAGSTRLSLSALLDWVADRPPTDDAIAARPVLAAGILHVKSIAECGGVILGRRPLEADHIEPSTYGSEPHAWGYTFPRTLAAAKVARRQ
jgi:hypothetical protein